MMDKKKLREIKVELAALLGRLPGRSPRAWLEREIQAAKGNAHRDVETLEMLSAVLARETRKTRKAKTRRRPA
jgi:hypothetical protein